MEIIEGFISILAVDLMFKTAVVYTSLRNKL